LDKKLLIIAYHFPPFAASGTFRTLSWSRLLAKRGWDITVLTTKNPQPPLDNHLLEGIPDSIRIQRTPCMNPIEGLSRIWIRKKSQSRNSIPLSNEHVSLKESKSLKDWLSWWLQIPDNRISWLPYTLKQALQVIKENKMSLIYSTSPFTTAHLIALLTKKICKIPWVADFRDPWRANPFRKIPYRSVDKWDEFLESSTMKQADHIICVTENMKNDFINRYPFTREKISYIPNGYDPEEYEDLEPLREFDENCFVLTHAGTFYGPRSPLPIFEALFRLQKESDKIIRKFRLQLIGRTEYNGERIEDMAKRFGIDSLVKVIPFLNKKKALRYMKGSNALLLVGFKGEKSEIQIPGKFFEYMAINKPIFVVAPSASGIGEMFYSENIDGEISEPGDISDISNKLIRMIKNDQDHPNNRIEKFNRHVLVQQLEKIFISLNCSSNYTTEN
jgi:glycosyltransferase involved in cell wall biosynthesis